MRLNVLPPKMIEEINSSQYVQHYFEKVYKELDYSPETFLRAALEYVHREAGLLSQPGALESLRRLAEHVAEAEGVTISVPETARPHAPEPPSVTTASVEPASGGAGARQPTPSAAGTPATPMASVDMAEGSAADAVEEDDEDIEVDGGSGLSK